MNVKYLEHYEVVATMYDGLALAGLCSSDDVPQLDCMETLCIYEDLTNESGYTEIRTRDISLLRVKPVLSDHPKEPAQ